MSKKLTKTQKKKIYKWANKNIYLVIILIMVIVGVLIFGYFRGWFDEYFKKDENPTYPSTAGGFETEVTTLNDLKINFLDVGQGDCIIIQLPDGKNMIIDSGQYEKAQEAITQFTTQNKITTFDYLLLTHADRDHVDKMSWVIDTYDIKYIFRPNNYSDNTISKDLPSVFNTKTEGGLVVDTKAYANFMVSAYNEGCTVEIFNKDSDFTNTIKYNGESLLYTFDFLTPVADRDKIVYKDRNNYSPIMMLTYGDTKIMFTGDAEEEMLEEYVSTYGSQNNVDILKVGHHGSENATTSEFIESIDPEYAIIQCGLGNSYGHPHTQTLSRLKTYDSNMQIFRNDTNGMITFSIGEEISVELENDDVTYNLTAGAQMPETLNFASFGDYISNRSILVA